MTRSQETSAHTPGPWAAFSDEGGDVVHTNIIAYVPRTDVVFSLPEHHKDDPNIRLITAAPDLLAALRAVAKLYDDESWPMQNYLDMDQIRKAIASTWTRFARPSPRRRARS